MNCVVAWVHQLAHLYHKGRQQQPVSETYQQKITGYKVSAWNWQVLPPLLVDNKPQLAFETTNQGIVHKLIEQTY